MRSRLVLCLLACACSDSTSPEPQAQPQQNTSPGEVERAGETAELENESPGSTIREAAAREVLGEWLRSQNEGDFEAYSELFASRFEGVKRAGAREYKFARAGWLENRRRMFQRPMTVAASDVRVRAVRSMAILRFTQRWSSATFEDVGEKELVVVSEDGQLRIAREEMLASELVQANLANDLFMLGLEHSGLYAVLAIDVDEEGGGSPVLMPRTSEIFGAWRTSEASGVEGREVRAFKADGTSCDGTLGPPRLLRRVVPHFGVVQGWDGEHGTPAASDDAIGRDVWEMAAERTLRVAEVVGCSEGVWVAGRDAQPQIYRVQADGGQRVQGAFRGLPEWATRQQEWSEAYDGEGPWDASGGAPPTEYQLWKHGEAGLVAVEGRGGSGCANFYGRLSAIFDVSEGTVFRGEEVVEEELDFVSVVDIEADGIPEVVVQDGLLRRNASGQYARVIDVTPPFLDCGC